MELRPYQAKAKADIHDAWGAGHTNVMAVLPTGAGKTVLFSDIIGEEKGASVAIAHRQELVGQISAALNRNEVPHKIIAPDKLIRYLCTEHIADTGRSFYDPNAQCAVAGVDTLIRRKSQFAQWMQQVRLWITDECFPAGTLVDGVPIEDIKVGDFVTAFNEVSGEFEYREVKRLFKNPIHNEMVKVVTQSHHVLQCTKGHPLWTKRGWVDASKLTTNDEVLINEVHLLWGTDNRNDGKSAVSIPENRKNILFEEVRLQVARRAASETSKDLTRRTLYGLREDFRPVESSVHTVEEYWQGLLFTSVFGQLPTHSVIRNNVEDQQEVRVEQDENKEPHVQPSDSKESVRILEEYRSQTDDSRWEWSPTYSCRNDTTIEIGGLRFQSERDRENLGCPEVPPSLQGGLWEQIAEDSSGSGRCESRITGEKGTGPAENRSPYWTRLESVSIYKPSDTGGTGDGYIYNIEVDELHTYVANGITVHNCHHVTADNKWGKACNLFPNARGLGVTATPVRADGLGLGRHADGLMDHMVQGPSMRDLINMGFLTEYRIFAPPNDLDLTDVNVTATGDYNKDKLKKAVQKSHLVGDVVQHYMRIAPGKLGVTFATDVETATEIAAQFNRSGVPAEVVSAKTPDSIRNEIIRRFRRREIVQLVNVDLFGEGFDLPAIEVVSMARPTQSYSLYVQQFGRALRILDGKEVAIIIDHAGNVVRHGLPDREREWSMDSRASAPAMKDPDDEIPLRYCVECTQPYERFYKYCPHCGHYPEPAGRDKPEYVDGDLMELSPEVLAEMREAIATADEDPHKVVARMKYAGAPAPAWHSAFKKITNRQQAQSALRESIAWWASMQNQMGHDDNQSYRKFYHLFGTDVMSAQTLNLSDSLLLAERVNTYLGGRPQ